MSFISTVDLSNLAEDRMIRMAAGRGYPEAPSREYLQFLLAEPVSGASQGCLAAPRKPLRRDPLAYPINAKWCASSCARAADDLHSDILNPEGTS